MKIFYNLCFMRSSNRNVSVLSKAKNKDVIIGDNPMYYLRCYKEK